MYNFDENVMFIFKYFNIFYNKLNYFYMLIKA